MLCRECIWQRADDPIPFLPHHQDSNPLLFQFNRTQTIPPSKTNQPQPFSCFGLFSVETNIWDGTLTTQHRLKSINTQPLALTQHILTHARFAIRISINLPIVLDNWETGWQRSNLLLTFIWAGAAAGVLTTTIITVKHPEWVSTFPFHSGTMFCLKIQNNQTTKKTKKIAQCSECKDFKVKLKKVKSRYFKALLYQDRHEPRIANYMSIAIIKTGQFLVLWYTGREKKKSISWSTENTQEPSIHLMSLGSLEFIKPDVLNTDSHTDLICKWAHSRWLQPIPLKFTHLRKLGREKTVQSRGHLYHRNRNERLSALIGLWGYP